MNKVFQIGAFCFRIESDADIWIPENFLLFEVNDYREIFYTYHLRVSDRFPIPTGQLLAERPDLTVLETESGEKRFLSVRGRRVPYACYIEIGDREAEIIVHAREIQNLRIDTVFTSLFALERRMIQYESLILHCAYMEYQGKAVLFSAPSETGKSTQADLWERYRGSRTINGDRGLLRKIDGRWMACGWPVCGSSEICNLGDIPIHAIVMLEQGKENHVERLSPFQAFALLYGQITINQWNKQFVDDAINLIEDLITGVPIWKLTCNISEDAVACLEEALF